MADFAITQPQASYAVYTFGLKHRWTYFLRTVPNIQDLLQPLEDSISNYLLPALVDHNCTPLERDILALPVKKGGIGVLFIFWGGGGGGSVSVDTLNNKLMYPQPRHT